MPKLKSKRKNNKNYQRGVADSLKALFHTITGMEHATGFRASALAQNHVGILKALYNNIHTTLVSND